MKRMDTLEIAHRRLYGQHLSGRPLPDPAAVVAHFGAMQAQEYALAKWSVAQRSGLDAAAVQAALDDGTILRTHALRPTWHFIAAADIRWIQALTGPRVHAGNSSMYRQVGADEQTCARTTAVMVEALLGGNTLTRVELAAALAKAGYEASGVRLAYLVMRAELDGLIASGPMRGKQHTYSLISERAPTAVVLEPDAALAELTRRYFTSHGPATVKDFAWWSSLTIAQIRRGLELVGSALSSVAVGGRLYWYVPGPVPARDPAPNVHVLQPYDEYLVAYSDSRLAVANVDSRSLPPPDPRQYPLIVDSQLVAFWRRQGTSVQVQPVRRLRVAEVRAIERAFDRYATTTGSPATVTVQPLPATAVSSEHG
jgi:hypothetical protein